MSSKRLGSPYLHRAPFIAQLYRDPGLLPVRPVQVSHEVASLWVPDNRVDLFDLLLPVFTLRDPVRDVLLLLGRFCAGSTSRLPWFLWSSLSRGGLRLFHRFSLLGWLLWPAALGLIVFLKNLLCAWPAS